MKRVLGEEQSKLQSNLEMRMVEDKTKELPCLVCVATSFIWKCSILQFMHIAGIV